MQACTCTREGAVYMMCMQQAEGLEDHADQGQTRG